MIKKTHVYTGSVDGVLCIWDVMLLSIKQKIKIEDPIRSIVISSDRLWIGGDLNIHLIDLMLNLEITSVKAHDRRINAVVFAINTGELWSCSDDGTIGVWKEMLVEDKSTITLVRRLDCKVDKIHSFCFTLDNRYILSGCYQHIFVWDVKTFSCTQQLIKVHTDVVTTLQAIDNFYIWSGSASNDGSINILETNWEGSISSKTVWGFNKQSSEYSTLIKQDE